MKNSLSNITMMGILEGKSLGTVMSVNYASGLSPYEQKGSRGLPEKLPPREELTKKSIVKYVVSQNIDGLHLGSGFPHNACQNFMAICSLKNVINVISISREHFDPNNGTGKLIDTILDWEDSLPERDLDRASEECRKSDLSICLGTSLQIIPSGNIPLLTKKNGGKLVIINLQPTKHDKKADLKICAYVDEVMKLLCDALNVEIPHYTAPSVCASNLIHTLVSEELSSSAD
ncbi:NAD-dependent protein deacetylase sirtuin-6 [Bulinus truncatus]|nr:NAD-dependent protein deacetylase sirtuin-6 [Bulinus truncatus]